MENRFLSSDLQLLQTGLFSDVKVTCKDRTWNLHKNILCSRSQWFDRALNGHFVESKTGVVDITNFEPSEIDCLLAYVYTGQCDIPKLKAASRKSHFVSCIEVHAVGDFFNERRLCEIALETLATEFDSKIGPMHMKPEPVDWLSELFEAIDLVYRDIPFGDPSPQSAPQSSVRAAFVQFVHTARYVLLQTDEFSRFLDAAPTFALDLFRAMRASADFVCTNVTNAFCSLCGNRPTRGEKKYYTHIGPEKLHLRATCSNCATKKDLPSGLEDWMGKKDSAASNLGKRES